MNSTFVVDGVDENVNPVSSEEQRMIQPSIQASLTPLKSGSDSGDDLINWLTPPTSAANATLIALNASTPSSNGSVFGDLRSRPDVLLSSTAITANGSGGNGKSALDSEAISALRMQELALQEQLITREQELCRAKCESDEYKRKCKQYFDVICELCSMGKDMMTAFREAVNEQESEKRCLISKVNGLTKEKDQALEDVQGVENSFAELHRRYEKMKAALESSKQNEEILMNQFYETQEKLKEKDELYETLRSKAEADFANANTLVENAKKSTEREITVLKAQLKKAEMKINGLQSQLDQKNVENAELTQMVDDLTKLKC
ncbi:transforming acidic coiled-coil-containing protein 3-like protein [Dinothrombium tinctorium]|uniref:Transforming acidic coiled-coil-containing protein 3-like protein n=1 Tax=Dinothrombium tinctorium TaxID=1965070 RepID=A0A443R747_9ACAR|nr:transforming acidic coiled-coil-containing protein 3-like protein [Dinothrombium tinctorium]